MKSKYFDDPAIALDVFVETFQRVAADPELSATIGKLNQMVVFDYSQDDPSLVFFVDSRGGNILVQAGRPQDQPAVTMVNSVDVAHQAWSNKLNPMVAMATGKLKAKGSASALLGLAPLLKKIAPIYNQVLADKGLGDKRL